MPSATRHTVRSSLARTRSEVARDSQPSMAGTLDRCVRGSSAHGCGRELSSEVTLFRCRVRIDQDPSGRVGEVILQRCNGTPEWQQSLVRAIADASPLSAPPNPAIFTPHIDLEFRSTAYAPGALNETFMAPPPPAVRAVNNAAVMLRTIRALRKQPFARAPGRSVIELNINGSQIHITTMHYPRKRGKHRRKKGRTPHGQRSSGLEDP